MFRTVICFLAICFFSTTGFSQDFYQSPVSFSAPSFVQSYPAQSYPVQSYTTQASWSQPFVVDANPVQSLPVQFSTSNVTGQIPTYNFSGVQTVNYGGIQSSGFSAQGGHIIDPNFGYSGPGDMRTHLWNDHAADLRANGVSQGQLMSMSMATVQRWHNYFHGSQGRPQ